MVKKKSVFKIKSILVVVLGVALLIMLIQAMIGPGGYQEGQKLKGKSNNLIRRIEAIKSENKQLENEIERLKTDPEEIEKIAREELGMVKPGEHKVVIKPNNNEKIGQKYTPSE
ncbi:MAG: septum formation initiator family protein [Acidobacteriia bacterium]|nr:septum formation initiator family protein [Terriglobia bacterium]